MAKQGSRRKDAAITLEKAMLLVPAEEFIRWQLDAPPRLPGEYLNENMRHLPELLGALDFVCAECARNVPAQNGA